MRINRHQARFGALLLAGSAIVTLPGCDSGSMSRTFGLVRDAPDEFTVTTQAPLSMPPEFNLRPPRPGVMRPQQQSERLAAEESLVPQIALAGRASGTSSPGQSALIEDSGAPAPADIRQKVDQDAKVEQASESFLDKVLYWRKYDTQNITVDPTGENQRLRQNAALGQSPEAGTTPMVMTKKKGWFQKLFDW